MASSSSTPSSSDKPFIGKSSLDIPEKKLGAVEDVLKVIAANREMPRCQSKPVKQMCCPVKVDRSAQCREPGGCIETGSHCLLFKVKIKYLQAGIKTVSDRRIVERLEEEQKKYKTVCNQSGRKNPAALLQRSEYLKSLKTTFDIKDPTSRSHIEQDSNIGDERRKQDLAFFDDYFGKYIPPPFKNYVEAIL